MDNLPKFDFESNDENQSSAGAKPEANPGYPNFSAAAPGGRVSTAAGNDLTHEAEHREQYKAAQAEFDDVIMNSRNVDEHLKGLLTRHQTTVMRVFPGKMQRLINSKERILVSEAMDFRITLLKLANEFRMEAMRDKYDCYLKAYKGQNRQMLTEILLRYVRQLYTSVRREEQATFLELNQMYAFANTFEEAKRRENYINRVVMRENRFLDLIDRQMIRFEAVIDEDLRRF